MKRLIRSRSFRLEGLESRQMMDAASLQSDRYEIHQNAEEQVLAVLANDRFDADYSGNRLISSVSLGSEGGRLRISDDGQSILYRPPADFAGNENFTYFVDQRATARVVVTIDSPLRNDAVTFHPDRDQYTIDVLANDPFWQDYQGARRITLTSDSAIGATVQISDDGRSIHYDRVPHRYASDTLTYIVDGRYPATLQVNIQQPLLDHRFEIIEKSGSHTYRLVSDIPLWNGYTGAQKITHLLDVPEGISVQVRPDGRSVEFDPQTQLGYFSLRYVVDSKFEGSLVVNVVHPVQDDWASVVRNSHEFAIDVLANDYYYSSIFHHTSFPIDIVDRVTSVTTGDKGGTTRIGANGKVLYTPPVDFTGTEVFRYTADEKYEAVVSVNVFETVDPIWRDDHFNLYEGTTDNVLHVLANDFPGSGYPGARVITSVSQPIQGGSVTIAENGKSLRFTPADGTYYATFTYTMDGEHEATVSVSLQALAQSDSYLRYSPHPLTMQVLQNDFFHAVNYAGPGLITEVTQPESGGTVTIATDGKSLRLSTGIGSAYFQYKVDGKFTGHVSVHYPSWLSPDYAVTEQNAASQKIDVLANDFDQYTIQHWGDYTGPRRVTRVTGAEHGTITVSDDQRSINYQPATDFVGSDSVTYTVDGFVTSTVTIDVTRRIRHDRVHVDPDSSNNRLNVLANDLVSGDYEGPLRISSVSSTVAGAVATVSPDGKAVVYTPAVGFRGTDRLEYTVDGRLKANVTVEVNSDVASLYPKFGSLDEFRAYLLKNANFQSGGENFFEDNLNSGPGASQDRDHSETNVQVEGVDEADLIETDSDHLYVLTHGQLVISRAWPATEMQVLSSTPFKGQAIGQYLLGDRLAVISQEIQYYWRNWEGDGRLLAQDSLGVPRADIADGFGRFNPYYLRNGTTYITLFDVSDRTAPQLVQRMEVEGEHVQTRRIEDHIYLVQRDIGSMTPEPQPICGEAGTNCRLETEAELRARFEHDFPSILEDTLPNYSSYGPDGTLARSGLVVQPEDVFRPLQDGSSSLISVLSIDMTQNEPGLASTAGVLTPGGSTLYVSPENIYVFDTEYSWQYPVEVGGVSPTTDELRGQDSPHTSILKFKLARDTGRVEFAASGLVPGVMLNQFSADEFEGNLRVATNISNHRTGNYSQHSENALFVLKDDVGVLEHVGTLQNLALNESIQSVRFFGQRAMVTTFRNIDPLTAIDLSDPANPQVEGHLTLPGFSTYMQFVAPDRLLTIGPSVAGSWGGSLAISLFDVTQMENPTLIDQHRWEYGSSSVAGYDHHAFGWFANHQTLAIPSVTNRPIRVDLDGDGYAETDRTLTINHLATFAIDVAQVGRSDAGVQYRGQITTESPLLRSAYIEDKLYAIANDSITAATISDQNVTLGQISIVPANPVVIPPTDPWLARLDTLGDRARADLADWIGVAPGSVMVVTSELQQDHSKMLLRVGDEQYVYQAVGDALAVQRSHYEAVEATGHQNTGNCFDTDGNGQVTARDVLLLINQINRGNDGPLKDTRVVRQIDALVAETGPMVDVNGDGYLSPRDVLQVINHINRQSMLPTPAPVAHGNAAAAADVVFATHDLGDVAMALTGIGGKAVSLQRSPT